MSADGPDPRQTLISAALAGVVALVVLVALSTANVGTDLVQAVVAIVVGVIVAQFYERTR